MPSFISEFLSITVDAVWGLPLVIWLTGGGVFLLFYSHLLPLKGFKHSFQLLFGKFHHKGMVQGQITHFQALTNALSATVGMGNIAGVAVAITQGGPGAIFWMWIAAMVGMITKFFECSLAVMYRGKDYSGEIQGGPMYVIENALNKKWHPMAYFFAFCGMIGCLPLFQVNQMAEFIEDQYQLNSFTVGVSCAFAVGFVLIGGLKRLARATASLVPTMGILYFVVCIYILGSNYERLTDLFLSIFQHAFTGTAAIGGAMGVGIAEILKTGIKRAAFSNEAGVGTAPMAHSNARTSEPISEGFVAMLGPFFDTIVICTLTAMVILLGTDNSFGSETSGVLLTAAAFNKLLPEFGIHFLTVAIFLFAFTTMLGMANYSKKCWDFIFKGRWNLTDKAFILIFCLAIVIGAVSPMNDVVNLIDICFALMAIPNMLVVFLLAPKVREALKEYLTKYGL